jgi:hypothetical protein
MTLTAKRMLSASLMLGLTGAGAAALSVFMALAGPFGGSDPPSSCGVNLSCVSDDFTADDATGSGFACSAALAECFDPGPGTCNEVGTNGSGEIILGGTDCNPTIRWGDSSVISGSSWTNTNGAINCEANCQIRDSGNGTLPINTTGGVVFNGTTPISGFLLVPVVIDIASIAASACDDVTATVSGVEANDYVHVTPNFSLVVDNVLVGNARVTNAGTDEVTFRACNVSLLAEDPDSGSFLFWVVRKP